MSSPARPVSADEFFQGGTGADADTLGLTDTTDGSDDSGAYQERPSVDMMSARRELKPLPHGAGRLLEEPSARKIFKHIELEIDAQDQLRRNREETRKHWDLVLGGCQFSFLEKSEDLSVVKQMFPPDIDHAPQPIPNKVADLKRKIVSQVLVDPFLPNPKPDGANSDRNRGAVDLVKKYLRQSGSPNGTNDQGMLFELLNMNQTAASSFVWQWMDPTGGGWQPKRLLAHPHATDPTKPLMGPKIDPATGQPAVDPTTGAPVLEQSSSPILRYVGEGQVPQDPADPNSEMVDAEQFTEDPASASRQWMPKRKRRVLNPAQVVCIPHTANVFDASKITLLLYEPLSEAKERFPILQTLTNAQLKTLCAWKPSKWWKAIVPEKLRPGRTTSSLNADGEVADGTLFYWYHHYCRVTGSYQDGAEIAVTGGLTHGFLLKRDTLREDVPMQDGTTVPVLRDPPVSQFLGYLDAPSGGDPYGAAPVADFGGANEIKAQLYMAVLDAIDKGLNPIPFIPSTSPVTREDLTRRDGRPVEITVPEDKPTWEQTPVIPSFTPQIMDQVDRDMNSAAGTNETSNGLDSSYSESGIAKQVSLGAARMALAQYWQNTARGLCHYWTCGMQLAQSFLTVPQEVMLSGVESAQKQRWFVGGDLLGVREIGPAPGSGTMRPPLEKLQLVSGMQNMKWLTEERAGELGRASMTDDLGIEPDVHEEAIGRQIGWWIEGPPPGWDDTWTKNQAATAQYQTAIQQAVAVLTSQGADPATAQQMAQQQVPPPQLTPLSTPFEEQPNDEEPGVAKTRARKLSELISSPDWSKHSAGWRLAAKDAYDKAFYAAGGQTVRQQAAAAQAAQQAQAAAAQAAQQAQAAQADAAAKAKTAGDASGAAAALEAKTADAGAQREVQQADASADREHQSAEAAREREHSANESALDRDNELFQNVFQSALQARTAAAKPAAATA